MNTITFKMGKEEAKRLIHYLNIVQELMESPYKGDYFKFIKGYKTSVSRLDQTIKYIQRSIDRI